MTRTVLVHVNLELEDNDNRTAEELARDVETGLRNLSRTMVGATVALAEEIA